MERYREAIATVSDLRQVAPEQAHSLFTALALSHHRWGDSAEARRVAERAGRHARTPQEAGAAESLLEIRVVPSTGLAPLGPVEEPGRGRPALERQRRRREVPFEPARAETPNAQTVEGVLAQFDCLGERARLRISADGRQLPFAILDPQSVVVRNNRSGVLGFSCGLQKPRRIGSQYRLQPDEKVGTTGVVLTIDLLRARPCVILGVSRGMFVRRIAPALRAFFSILFRGRLPDDLARALNAAPKAAPAPASEPERQERASDGALQMLGILQQDARLIDFLMEDISGYPDDQVGAAVRTLHEECRRSLEHYVRLAPVVDGVEGTYTRLEATPDPARLKLIGNVPIGVRPEGGLLRHKGWRAVRIQLPPLEPGKAPEVIAPAEIEIE